MTFHPNLPIEDSVVVSSSKRRPTNGLHIVNCLSGFWENGAKQTKQSHFLLPPVCCQSYCLKFSIFFWFVLILAFFLFCFLSVCLSLCSVLHLVIYSSQNSSLCTFLSPVSLFSSLLAFLKFLLDFQSFIQYSASMAIYFSKFFVSLPCVIKFIFFIYFIVLCFSFPPFIVILSTRYVPP